MGTPACTQIISGGKVTSFSQRSDGYPEFALTNLAQWIVNSGCELANGMDLNAESLQLIHLNRYSPKVQENCEGLDLFEDAEPNIETDTHTWNYVVDLDNKVITTYCNDSFLEKRQGNPPCDPLLYVKIIRDDCVEYVESRIREAMDILTGAGFTFKIEVEKASVNTFSPYQVAAAQAARKLADFLESGPLTADQVPRLLILMGRSTEAATLAFEQIEDHGDEEEA